MKQPFQPAFCINCRFFVRTLGRGSVMIIIDFFFFIEPMQYLEYSFLIGHKCRVSFRNLI